MKSLIIGDVHNLTNLVDEIVNNFGSRYDEIVIVGDYFDSFGDNLELTQQTALWLKARIDEKKIKLIIGNHDIHYFAFRNLGVRGSGYSRNKADVINRILKIEDWRELLFFYKTQGFVISHAGIGQHLFHPLNGLDLDVFQVKCREAWYNLLHGEVSEIFNVGKARGGWLPKGGITWQDWDMEFSPVKDLNQICGHTHNKTIRYKNYDGSVNVCVDCLPHYVLEIDDGKLKEIKLRIEEN